MILVLVASGIYYFVFLNQETVLEESTRTVEYFHWQKMIVTYEEDATIDIDFSIVEGIPVDLLVFNKTGYNEFYYIMTMDSGLFKPLISELNVESASLQFKVPSDGLFYVIVNNAGKIDGGALPRGDVTFFIKISSNG